MSVLVLNFIDIITIIESRNNVDATLKCSVIHAWHIRKMYLQMFEYFREQLYTLKQLEAAY